MRKLQLVLFEVLIILFFKSEEILFKLILLTLAEITEVVLSLIVLPMMFDAFFILLILST